MQQILIALMRKEGNQEISDPLTKQHNHHIQQKVQQLSSPCHSQSIIELFENSQAFYDLKSPKHYESYSISHDSHSQGDNAQSNYYLESESHQNEKIESIDNSQDQNTYGPGSRVNQLLKFCQESQQKIEKPEQQYITSNRYQPSDFLIKQTIEKNRFCTTNEIKLKLYENHNMMIGKDQLIKQMKRLGFKNERYTIKKQSKNGNRELSHRHSYARNLYSLQNKNAQILYFGDCCFALEEFQGKMWATFNRKGEMQYIPHKNQIVTLNIILSTSKVEFFQIWDGNSTYQNFQSSISCWINMSSKQQHISCSSGKYLAYDDNTDNRETQNFGHSILRTKDLTLLKIPEFSPDLNPTQIIFNTIKYNVRGDRPKSVQDLKLKIKKNIDCINLNDLSFAFNDLNRCLKRAFEQQSLC